jgi:hypothetical protein
MNANVKRAEFRHDGCRTDADVRYRQEMLRNIATAHTQRLILVKPQTWVTA